MGRHPVARAPSPRDGLGLERELGPVVLTGGPHTQEAVELSEGADEFLLPITQEELAGMVGASRERVNKAIASFIRLGYIDQHERHYTILKRDAMELRAR